MFSMLIGFAVAMLLATFLLQSSRRFVRTRLRYVDVVQRGIVPWMAGGVVFLLASVLSPLLPFFGLGTALTAGVAVGTGVAAGVRDIRSGSGMLYR